LRHILNYISRSISFNINADDKLKAVFNGKLKVSSKTVVKFRVAKAAKDAVLGVKK
jgi:hypothetical protein